MQKRALGSTGLLVSEIGIGAWQFGGGLESGVGHGWGGIDDEESMRVVHAAEDLGINFIDTADIYGNGRSETVIGQALAGRRDRWVVATKVGLIKKPEDEGQYLDASGRHVAEGVEASLRRLRMETIDVYQLHGMPSDEELPEAMATLERLRGQGKIRYYGISTDALEHVQKCRRYGAVSVVQLAYSLTSEGRHELLDYCGRERLGVIVRSPLGLGLLTGSYFGGRFAFAANDHRSRWWNNDRTRALLQGFTPLEELAQRHGCKTVQFALRYVLDRHEVSVVIPGTKSVAQLKDNVAASDVPPLPPDLVAAAQRVIAEAKAAAPAAK